jgi:hypothetical protein
MISDSTSPSLIFHLILLIALADRNLLRSARSESDPRLSILEAIGGFVLDQLERTDEFGLHGVRAGLFPSTDFTIKLRPGIVVRLQLSPGRWQSRPVPRDRP